MTQDFPARVSPVKKSTIDRSLPLRMRFLSRGLRLLERVSPESAARAAAALFCRTQAYPRPTREVEWLESARSFRFVVENEELAGWVWGEQGPPIYLAHGWEGRGAQLGAFAAPLVGAGFRVVTWDGPGHGESRQRSSSVVQLSRALQAVMTLHGPPHAIVAHSLGTAAACWASPGDGTPRRWVFLSPPRDLSTYPERLIEALGLSENTRLRMIDRIERTFRIRWQDIGPITRTSADSQPLLVITDVDDDETPYEDGRAVAAAWRRGRFLGTAGLGHRRILRDPGVVAEVTRFLTEPLETVAKVELVESLESGIASYSQARS